MLQNQFYVQLLDKLFQNHLNMHQQTMFFSIAIQQKIKTNCKNKKNMANKHIQLENKNVQKMNKINSTFLKIGNISIRLFESEIPLFTFL